MVAQNIFFFMLIVFLVSLISLGIRYNEPKKILVASARLFAMIVGGVLLFCIIVEILQSCV